MQKSSEINQRNKLSLWLLNNPKINPYNNLFKMYTSYFRLLPDVIICGFHKTSTTSLHHYLIQHPNIIKFYPPMYILNHGPDGKNFNFDI